MDNILKAGGVIGSLAGILARLWPFKLQNPSWK